MSVDIFSSPYIDKYVHFLLFLPVLAQIPLLEVPLYTTHIIEGIFTTKCSGHPDDHILVVLLCHRRCSTELWPHDGARFMQTRTTAVGQTKAGARSPASRGWGWGVEALRVAVVSPPR